MTSTNGGILTEDIIDSNGDDENGNLPVEPCDNQCTENITSKAEEYLNSDDVKLCADPKLKREKQKLEDLLRSYKKLISKLERKYDTEEERKAEEKRLSKVPEIYAILHPELYKNPRDEEKAKLIQKFAKRQFSPIDRVIPPSCRTPVFSVTDKRQEEKERLIKIISSCPGRFHNTVDNSATPVKIRKPKISSHPLLCPINDRDLEKERLSKIFATSGAYYRRSLDRRTNNPTFRKTKEILPRDFAKNKVSFEDNMVRVGEYSPLSSRDHTTNLLHGVGEHEGRRTQLMAERRKEYKEQQDSATASYRNGARLKADKALSTNEPEDATEVDGEDGGAGGARGLRSPGLASAATQTEFYDAINGNYKPKENGIEPTKELPPNLQDRPRNAVNDVFYRSPREKLMSDLHGVSKCFPGVSSCPREDIQDIKQRQAAYAKALKEQIEEKRRLEEIRKRKEKEEEELIEQRLREQQEKLESEVNEEEKKRHDWIAQRQSHEEVLRRRMLELELEAQELKKAERRKRAEVTQNMPERPRRDSLGARPLPPPQTTLSEPSRSVVPPPVSHESPQRSKFEGLRMAPLLDADRQNVLSSNALSPNVLTLHPSPSRYEAAYYKPVNDVINARKEEERERAEKLLKAPLDFRIDRPSSPPLPAVKSRMSRPSSPPIPAVKTRDILNNNTKVLEDKWEVPKGGQELKRTQAGTGRDNILTQLGAFRRQLHQEHVKLEARLQRQQTP